MKTSNLDLFSLRYFYLKDGTEIRELYSTDVFAFPFWTRRDLIYTKICSVFLNKRVESKGEGEFFHPRIEFQSSKNRRQVSSIDDSFDKTKLETIDDDLFFVCRFLSLKQ